MSPVSSFPLFVQREKLSLETVFIFFQSKAPSRLQTAQTPAQEHRAGGKDLKSVTWPGPRSAAASSLPKSPIRKQKKKKYRRQSSTSFQSSLKPDYWV